MNERTVSTHSVHDRHERTGIISVINIRTHKEISLFLMDFLYEVVENHCLLCLSKTALRSLSTPASEQKKTSCC